MPSQAMGGGNVQALMVPLSLIPKEQCSGGSCLSGQKEKKIYIKEGLKTLVTIFGGIYNSISKHRKL